MRRATRCASRERDVGARAWTPLKFYRATSYWQRRGRDVPLQRRRVQPAARPELRGDRGREPVAASVAGVRRAAAQGIRRWTRCGARTRARRRPRIRTPSARSSMASTRRIGDCGAKCRAAQRAACGLAARLTLAPIMAHYAPLHPEVLVPALERVQRLASAIAIRRVGRCAMRRSRALRDAGFARAGDGGRHRGGSHRAARALALGDTMPVDGDGVRPRRRIASSSIR